MGNHARACIKEAPIKSNVHIAPPNFSSDDVYQGAFGKNDGKYRPQDVRSAVRRDLFSGSLIVEPRKGNVIVQRRVLRTQKSARRRQTFGSVS